jgi:hypothetical protein
LIKFESGAHWYNRDDGSPKHDADLRVARKAFLYPSVTTIDKDVFKNDFLDRWKMNELALAAAENFRQPHESIESYANRIYEASLHKTLKASNFGKQIHSAIEEYPKYPEDPTLHPWIDKFGGWFENNLGDTSFREKVFVDHDLGVAGCCDFGGYGAGPLLGKRVLCDWKSQNVKKDDKGRKKPAYYDSWTRQLAFYAVCDAKEQGAFPNEIPTCVSVVIDSNEADDPFVKVWHRDEVMDAYRDFVAGSYLWFSKRSFWPQLGGPLKLNPSVPMPI